jgi:ABC-type uncharacterized transport system substrate-binding protein
MADVGNPIAAGFVASLGRPGGNITGVSALSEELSTKRLELLKEAVPKVSRVGVLLDPTHPTNSLDFAKSESAAKALRLSLRPAHVTGREDLESAFSKMTQERVGAKPADLPVEEPRKLELVINLRSAKALGLTISQSLLLRADQIIE